MPIKLICVLRGGGDYSPGDVAALMNGLRRHLPGYDLVCLSDMAVPCPSIPLAYPWGGWWSKMELFRPDLDGDALFFDLDTAIIGDLSDMVARLEGTNTPFMLSDFYFEHRPASGLMFIPQSWRAAVWQSFTKDPAAAMRAAGAGGDQAFLATQVFGLAALRWQRQFPGKVVSYKVHVRGRAAPPKDASIVCFHGRPRPATVNHEWLREARA